MTARPRRPPALGRSCPSGRRRRPATGTVTARVLDTDSLSATRYQGFADVTSSGRRGRQRRLHASGTSQTGTGEDRYGGWGLVVVYRDPAESVRRLLVYDGLLVAAVRVRTTRRRLAHRASSRPRPAPSSAASASSRGKATSGITGDTATFAGRALTDTLNPVDNVFNSTISRAGAATTGEERRATSTSSASTRTSSRSTASSATTCRPATLHLATATDLYLPGRHGAGHRRGPAVRRRRRRPSAGPPATARRSPPTRALAGLDRRSPYTYQWRRCDASGANCADIAGATGATYALGTADVGSTDPGRRHGDERGRLRRRDLDPDRAGSPPRRPSTPASPSISGTTRDGETLTADQRHLDRHADDHLRLPVAPLRHRRRELRRHRRRDGVDVQAARRRRRLDDPRRRDRDERRRVDGAATSGADRRASTAVAPREHGRPDDPRHRARRRRR